MRKSFPFYIDNVTRQEGERNPFCVKKMSSRNNPQPTSTIKGKKKAFSLEPRIAP